LGGVYGSQRDQIAKKVKLGEYCETEGSN